MKRTTPQARDDPARFTIVGLVDGVSTRVSWREIDPSEYAQPGAFVVTGTVEGTSLQGRATVTVKEESS